MSYECEFCHAKFTSKYTVKYHQERTKYCLNLRGVKKQFFECEICEKTFSNKKYLDKHIKICNKRYVSIIEEHNKIVESLRELNNESEKTIARMQERNKCLEQLLQDQTKQITELQNKLENVAIQGVKKSTTTTNNTINLQPLTKEWMAKQALLLTEEHLSQGVSGLAQFAVDNSFKDRVICTDITRKSLKYKENDGKVSKDPRGKKLSKMFFESIEAKAEDIIPTMIERIKEEMDIVCEETGGVFESVCSKMDEIIKVKKGIKHITKGQEHELKEEFTRQLCELLPNP